MTDRKKLRARKLIQPGLQLRLVGSFAGLAVFAMLLQFLLLGWWLTGETMNLQGEGGAIARELPEILLKVLAISLGIQLPLIVAIGVLLTFRIAGPVHRFSMYLSAIQRGEPTGPCRLRARDELQELCDQLNEVTEPLRRTEVAAESDDATAEPAPQAAAG